MVLGRGSAGTAKRDEMNEVVYAEPAEFVVVALMRMAVVRAPCGVPSENPGSEDPPLGRVS